MNQVAAKRQESAIDSIRIAAFNGNGSAGEWTLRKTVLTIGRVSTNDVCLNDKKVSRTHCTVELRPEGLFLKDGGSSNGTWVNGQKVSEKLLQDLDVVVIAGYRLQLSHERAAGAPEGEGTPADEDSNVIPMRNARTAAERQVRTDVVAAPAMAEQVRAASALPAIPELQVEFDDAPRMPAEPKFVQQARAEAARSAPAKSAPPKSAPAAKAAPAKPAPAAKAEPKAVPASAAKAEPRPPSRPAVMYVGGKRIVRPADAPPTERVEMGAKKPMSKGMKIALVIGGLMVSGMVLLVAAGGGIAYYVYTHPIH